MILKGTILTRHGEDEKLSQIGLIYCFSPNNLEKSQSDGAVDLGVDRQKQFCEEVTTVRDAMTNPTEIRALIFIGGLRRGKACLAFCLSQNLVEINWT